MLTIHIKSQELINIDNYELNCRHHHHSICIAQKQKEQTKTTEQKSQRKSDKKCPQ